MAGGNYPNLNYSFYKEIKSVCHINFAKSNH